MPLDNDDVGLLSNFDNRCPKSIDHSDNDHPMRAVAEPPPLVMFHQSMMGLARFSSKIAKIEAMQQSGKVT